MKFGRPAFALARQAAFEAADTVLACVDGSAYTEGVCDHAAWAADRLGASVRVLHVVEDGQTTVGTRACADDVLDSATMRLRETGAEVAQIEAEHGGFSSRLSEATDDIRIAVLGRRGRTSEQCAGGLGGNVRQALARCRSSVLIAGRVFLPIQRAVVLMPAGAAWPYQRFVRESALLDQLETEVRSDAWLRHAAQETDPVDLVVLPRSLACGAGGDVLTRKRPVLVV